MPVPYARLIRKLLCLQLKRRFRARGAQEKTIYLTFDDGPHEVHTPAILDLLQTFDAKATFFVIGEALLKNKELAERIVKEGHLLGNHTFSHQTMTSLPSGKTHQEVMTCQELIDELQGGSLRLFRPPCGLIGVGQLFFLKARKLTPCLWTLDSQDCFRDVTEPLVPRLVRLVGDCSIILFHDDSAVSLELLGNLLPYWKSQGFRFEALLPHLREGEG